jgi:hypothetical protein
VSRVLIRFEGEGSGVGELSWGQQEIWRAIRRYGDPLSLGGVTALPPGTTVDEIAASLAFLIGRHQSLRTRLTFDAHGHARQVVADSGELALEIVDAGDAGDTEGDGLGADPAKVADAVLARLSATDFDYEHEWPVRVAVIRHRAALTHMVAVYFHLALDQWGLDALIADLANRDPATGLATRPVTGTPSLEQAAHQGTAAARQQSETALRYWERMLRSIPAQRFRDPAGGAPERNGAGHYVDAYFTSPATRAALAVIAARSRTGTASVLLAAYAVALARVTGRNPSVARVVVGNRFRPGFADSVSTVNQPGLCVIDVAGIGFEEAIARAARASMNAYKHAYYDPARREELIQAISRERGEEIDLSCFFNDRRGPDIDSGAADALPAATTAPDVRNLLRDSTLRWIADGEQFGERLFVHVEDHPGGVLFKGRADTRHLRAADLEALLRGVEAVLVEAVEDANAATDVA